MSKTSNGSGKSAQAASEADEASDVGKIRDIIFGEQMLDYDRRFKALEGAMERRFSESSADVEAQAKQMHDFVVAEISKLTEKGDREAEERSRATAELEKSAKATAARMEERLSELDEHLAKESADIRHEMIDGHNQVLSETKALLSTLDEMVQSSNQDLHDKKADRTELADLFKSFAMSLNRSFDLPEADA